MNAFILDFREILRGNREAIFTYFPDENLLFKGRKCPGKVKTFWFDPDLYASGSRGFGEVFAKTDKLDRLAEELDANLYLSAKSTIETYSKVYAGIDAKTLFTSLIPEGIILQYGRGLADLTQAIFEKRTKPNNYSFLLDERDLVEGIWNQELNLLSPPQDKKILPRVMYDMYKGVTGRLNHAPRSFPILSLARERRGMVAPSNDLFVEYDMQSADFRTFLYLFSENPEKFQDKQDLYEDIPGSSRAEKKQKVFQTIYATHENAFLKRHDVFPKALDRIFKEDENYVWVHSPFGREIRIDKSKGSLEHLIVSYLIQSVTNDIMIQKAVEVKKMLKDTKSRIAFLIHDCFVVDFAKEDYDRFGLDIRNAIQYCDQGRFFWHEKAGKTLGELEPVLSYGDITELKNDRTRTDDGNFPNNSAPGSYPNVSDPGSYNDGEGEETVHPSGASEHDDDPAEDAGDESDER